MADALTWEQIRAWRKAERVTMIERRASRSDEERRSWNDRITAHLVAALEPPAETVIGFCWPYKGEFDARFAMRHWRAQGALGALPEVVDKKGPLQFGKWWPGAPMRPGVYDIPVPDGTEVLVPDVALVPMNAFDEQGYRLGYGGGYFDRTLAAVERRMVAIGVSYEMLRLPTIHPQPHDIPMDFVVTEAGIYAAGGKRVVAVGPEECRTRVQRLMIARRLPRAAFPESYSSPVCYGSEFRYFGDS